MSKDVENILKVALISGGIGFLCIFIGYALNGFQTEGMNDSGIAQVCAPFLAIFMIICFLVLPIGAFEILEKKDKKNKE